MDLTGRASERKAEFIAAGVSLIGAIDGQPVGVRDVCRAAGLTERYFYLSFGNREEFVRAVYDHVAMKAREVLTEAIREEQTPVDRATAAVRGFVALMIDQPTMGRVLLIAPATEANLGRRGPSAAMEFVSLVQSQLPGPVDEAERKLAALAIVGALTALFTTYLRGAIDVSRERFADYCVTLVLEGGQGPSPA